MSLAGFAHFSSIVWGFRNAGKDLLSAERFRLDVYLALSVV
jgi:hypothetical protein